MTLDFFKVLIMVFMIPYHVICFNWYDGRLFSGKPPRYGTAKMPERG